MAWMSCAAMAWPAALPRNHSAIAWLAKARGARRVVAERPTGERHSSATVWMTKTLPRM